MQRLPTEVRQAARQLWNARGFTAAIVLILALGTGTSTAVFTVVDSVLFQPVRLPDSERLVTLCEIHKADRGYCTVSPPNSVDWQNARSLAAVGVARRRAVVMRDGGRRTGINAAVATPGFLAAVGAAPAHGRLLLDDDGPPQGSGHVVVLSHELWQSRFGGDPGIVGTTFTGTSEGDGASWHDVPVTVVGILPPGIRVPRFDDVEAWIPFQFDPRAEEHRNWRGFVALARLAEGAAIEDAEAELNHIQLQLAATYPDALRNWTVDAVNAREWLAKDVRSLLLLFLAAVGLVLVIVCVNVISLLLARAPQRERELTVRAALGAGRGRLLEQLIVEAALLALLGAIGGVLMASWLLQAFVALAPAGVPRLDEIGLDPRALAFTVGVTLALTLLFGMAPYARLRLLRLHDVLRGGPANSPDRRGNRVRNALVISQFALALTLVLSAGLLLRSFARQAAFDPGFELSNLLTFQVYPSQERLHSGAELAAFYAHLEEQLAALPGVERVGTASSGPFLGGGDGRTPFLIAGRPPLPIPDAPTIQWYDAGPGFFPTLGVPLIQGRNLSDDDRLGAIPTALVNRTAAARHWPGSSPIGAILSLPDWRAEVEIVGVVEDMRNFEDPATQPAIFVSNRQRPRWASFVVLRTSMDPASLISSVRSTVARLDSDLQPHYLMTMQERLADRLVAPRFNVLIVALFGMVALVLSATGLYALIAYNVALRTREFGIRMALGAPRRQVLGSVLHEGIRLLLAGLALGLLGAVFFTRLLRSLLHEVALSDPIAIAGTVLVLVVTAVVACIAPAARAGRIAPITALRTD